MKMSISAGTARILGQKLTGLTPEVIVQRTGPTIAALLAKALREMQQAVSGPVLAVRSGNLRGSLQVDLPHVEGDAMVSSIGVTGSAAVYGKFLIHGGTITPKRGKYLPIPVGPALTGARVPRYASARDVPDLHFIPRTRSGNPILAKIVGRGTRRHLEPYFVLKTSVTIGPHDYVSAVRERLEAAVGPALRKAVTSAVL